MKRAAIWFFATYFIVFALLPESFNDESRAVIGLFAGFFLAVYNSNFYKKSKAKAEVRNSKKMAKRQKRRKRAIAAYGIASAYSRWLDDQPNPFVPSVTLGGTRAGTDSLFEQQRQRAQAAANAEQQRRANAAAWHAGQERDAEARGYVGDAEYHRNMKWNNLN